MEKGGQGGYQTHLDYLQRQRMPGFTSQQDKQKSKLLSNNYMSTAKEQLKQAQQTLSQHNSLPDSKDEIDGPFFNYLQQKMDFRENPNMIYHQHKHSINQNAGVPTNRQQAMQQQLNSIHQVQISHNQTVNSWFVQRLKNILSGQIQVSGPGPQQAHPSQKQKKQVQRNKNDELQQKLQIGGQQLVQKPTPQQVKYVKGSHMQIPRDFQKPVQMSVQGNSAALCNSAQQYKNNRENSMLMTDKSPANMSFSPISHVGMRKNALPDQIETTLNASTVFSGAPQHASKTQTQISPRKQLSSIVHSNESGMHMRNADAKKLAVNHMTDDDGYGKGAQKVTAERTTALSQIEGADAEKGTSKHKLVSRDMLIKSDLNTNQEKDANEDDYHILKRTVWLQMAKADPLVSDPKAQYFETTNQVKLMHQQTFKESKTNGSAELKASVERKISNPVTPFIDQRADMKKHAKMHFNEIGNAALENKHLNQSQALVSQAYQLSGATNGTALVSAQSFSRTNLNSVMMQQSNSQAKQLNLPYQKLPGQPPMLNSGQTHRYSLEKLKEFEIKLLQQSTNNTSSKQVLSQERQKLNQAELADAAIYGLNKHSHLTTGQNSTNLEKKNEIGAFNSTGTAQQRYSDDHGSIQKNDENLLGTRNFLTFTYQGNSAHGGPELMAKRQ